MSKGERARLQNAVDFNNRQLKRIQHTMNNVRDRQHRTSLKTFSDILRAQNKAFGQMLAM